MSLIYTCHYDGKNVLSSGKFPWKFGTLKKAQNMAREIKRAGYDCTAFVKMTGPNKIWPEYLVKILYIGEKI